MVYTCFLCKWRSDKQPQRSYHKFPSNNELKQKWLDLLGKSNVSIGIRTTLCSIHFEEGCFRHGLVYERKILKDGSLPTLHLTKDDTRNQIIIPTDTVPESPMESILHTELPTADNVHMKEPVREWNVEIVQDNPIKVLASDWNPAKILKEICLHAGSSRKSGPLDVQSKKKRSTLKHSTKHLPSPKCQMIPQLTELKKTDNRFIFENKLMDVSIYIGKTVTKIKRNRYLPKEIENR